LNRLTSVIPWIVMLWSLWGAIADLKYMKRGGKKPDWTEGIPFLAIGCGFAGLIAVDFHFTGDPAHEFRLAVFGGIFILGLWEYSRWGIRRKHPPLQTDR
jgi:hypothetical protein